MPIAAPLAQVLSDNTHTYVYGHQRLLAVQGDTRTWHLADALGSLRMTLDGTGTPQSLHSYDAWGVVQEGTPSPFGFTGEVQQAGLVYLRARWYAAGSGTFTSRDPFAGYSTHPNTLHPYMYAANTPLLYTDPSGRCYNQLGFLRDVEPGNCHNLDMAIKIFNHPNASLKERTAAYAYVSTWTASHAMLLVGAGFGGGALLTESVIAAGAAATEVSLLGAAAMANVPTVAKTAVGVSLVVADKDDALMYFYAALGDEQAVADYQALQQLGTSDPSPVCDVLAAGIFLSKGLRKVGKSISLGVGYSDYTQWRFDGRVDRNRWEGVANFADRYNFPSYFREAANNAEEIHFDITKVDIHGAFRQGYNLKPVDEGGAGYTAFELYTILNDKELFNKVVFHRRGNRLSGKEEEAFYYELVQAGWIIP